MVKFKEAIQEYIHKICFSRYCIHNLSYYSGSTKPAEFYPCWSTLIFQGNCILSHKTVPKWQLQHKIYRKPQAKWCRTAAPQCSQLLLTSFETTGEVNWPSWSPKSFNITMFLLMRFKLITNSNCTINGKELQHIIKKLKNNPNSSE